ncbi:mRNA cleavage and polyadenylation factor subunit [Komagataella phaffii CBS 7435]|uniref:RNA-binding subunit of the mRNA cleavage and polyadenylation factor n=2 Tax=Komagataella phaffii TaxID=460519 RepID=C4QVH3_KOMPG|nr:RNA-binding subunit of the mRNA cleavage and polyadenylation factor [Komagataella phaffii GS115]AOA60474.1 GQ67_02438T0 [Komagataella phaffii]CAH2445902.1 mRNA cleavage and polyadenylation factor subunit [Komagataella phaffii CBS 7435]AOA66036.1 GQ68_02809T0 [Komagataella phaffii GS115]CAY67246.1 RNA-binding subunit of the mRNA cleavage and polyadenylation factor [Komagataella phaffii GS115]CCA36350.1 mRNA cleavage and polyadenylation factor subunit [Komagataella phaffii CBS 7435]
MDVYHQFLEPTVCTHSLSANFTNSVKNDLIIAKGTLLQIFEVINVTIENKQDEEQPDLELNGAAFGIGEINEDALNVAAIDFSQNVKLSLVAEYKLDGLVTDLCKIRTIEDSHHDYVLVATKGVKFSMIKWDQSSNSISTVSLHHYKKIVENSLIDKFNVDTKLIADPNNHCSCLLANEILFFLPFLQHEVDEELDGKFVENKKLYSNTFLQFSNDLQPNIKTIIDIEFLHGYSEPTLAVLYTSFPTCTGALPKAKDTVSLQVFSLNLQNKASTSIIEVNNLPYDTDRILPLSSPLNGCLLIGANQIIHLNSMGTAKGISCNLFAAKCSNFKLSDQSNLDLRLEKCVLGQVYNDKVILITEKGAFYAFSFDIVGGVSSINEIQKIAAEKYQGLVLSLPTMFTNIDGKTFFIGCQGSDSVLFGSKARLNTQNVDVNGKSKVITEEDALYEEDLYADDIQNVAQGIDHIDFVKLDSLLNIGPITNFTTGSIEYRSKLQGLPNPNWNDECIIAAGGLHESGQLSLIQPTISPTVRSSLTFNNVEKLWTLEDENGDSHYLITTDSKKANTEVFLVKQNYKHYSSKGFVTGTFTKHIAVIPGKDGTGSYGESRIVQVTAENVILYDFKLKKLLSLSYEGDDIVSVDTFENYMLITKESGMADILHYDEEIEAVEHGDKKESDGETSSKKSKTSKKGRKRRRKEEKMEAFRVNHKLDVIPLPKALSQNDYIFITGCIANSDILNKVDIGYNNIILENGEKGKKSLVFFLVTAENSIVMFLENHKEKVFKLSEAKDFSTFLNIELIKVGEIGQPDPFIKQITVSEIGDEIEKQVYLTILTIGGEVIIYKQVLNKDSGTFQFIKDNYSANITITGAPDNAYPQGTKLERRLIKLNNIGDSKLSTLFVVGVKSFWITKRHSSSINIHQFTKLSTISCARFNTSRCKNGLMIIDTNKAARMVEIPSNLELSQRLPIRRVPVGCTIKCVAFHKASRTFVVSTVEETPYNCVDEEGNPIVGVDNTINKPASSFKSSIKLISPISWTVIDSFDLEDEHVCMSLKSMTLNTSRIPMFKNLKEYLVLGISNYRMEDLASNGQIRIVDVVDIIPEPGKPETNHKFKDIFQDATKGAVTSVSDISGRFVIGQGQKIIVRDLQEDNTALPVGFVDTPFYVSETKSFQNLLLVGDSMHSVILVGFDAEPYRMISLGKDVAHVDVCAADFVVFEGNLFIIIADEDGMLHLIQYDPEDPASMQGQRLLRRSIFKTNQYTTCMKMRERKYVIKPPKNQFTNFSEAFEVVAANSDGSFYKVTPISEATYRRLYVIQQQIFDQENHKCGLNPRENRYLSDQYSIPNQRLILDFDNIRRFLEFDEIKKRDLVHKLGRNTYSEFYRDLLNLQEL